MFLLKKTLKKLSGKLIQFLRKNQRINALMYFYDSHGRFPNKNLRNIKFDDFLYYRKKELWDADLSQYTDKIRLKDYISNTVGREYCVPIQGVYNCADDINLENLSYPCVLKSNHACGHVIFLTSPNSLTPTVKSITNEWLKIDYFKVSSEPSYRNITPHLFIEDKLDIKKFEDYKFHCFSGNIRMIEVYIDRFSNNHSECYYDTNWTKLPQIYSSIKYYTKDIPKPQKLDFACQLAKDLSKQFKYIRIDMFISNENIFIGEFTFFPANGTSPIVDKYNKWLLEYLTERNDLI